MRAYLWFIKTETILMKNQSNLRLFLFLLCTITLLNCKKLADVEPKAIADKMVGKYTMSELIIGNQTLNLPYKQGTDELNGVIEIVKTNDTEITLTYTFTSVVKGVKDTDTAEDIFYVKQGSKDLELFEDEKFTTQIGSLVDGKTLYIVSNITDRITAVKD
jgi:hypothetical protein